MAKKGTITDLKKELAAKEKQLQKLSTKRDNLVSKLVAIDRQIESLCGSGRIQKSAVKRPRKTGGRRKKGENSLADILSQVLKGKGSVRVGDAARMAIEAGYSSSSNQFGSIVSQTLANDKRFRKVRRGLFKLKD